MNGRRKNVNSEDNRISIFRTADYGGVVMKKLLIGIVIGWEAEMNRMTNEIRDAELKCSPCQGHSKAGQ